MASGLTVAYSSGSIWHFTYTPAALSGSMRVVMYGTALGPIATQAFEYDFIEVFFAATLLEDSDGIVPAGSGTCDITPTVQWTAPTGSVGPFLYAWTLRHDSATGSVVVSGITVNVNSATMPTLTPGIYQLSIVATDSGGGTSNLHPLLFRVLDCKFALPPKVITIDPFDIEPAVPTDEDYIRYLPQWMNVHGTATVPPSASTTFRLFKPFITELRGVEKESNRFSDQSGVLEVPINLPRKAWHLQTRFTAFDVISVNCIASGIITPVRRETSTYNFLITDDPVYILGDNGHMVFRNLAQREVTVAPVSGSTGATGSTLAFLSHQYQMPYEHEGIVGDSNVLFFFDGLEYRIKAGSAGVDPDQAVVQLTDPYSGTITFRYQSKTLAPVVMISISGNPAVSPSPTDLWNRFDELGLLCGLRRRDDEDNLVFRKRVYARFISNIGTNETRVAEHISQDLTLVDVLPWDGVSTIYLAASGYTGIKYIEAEGLPQTDFRNEELVRFGSNFQVYSASKSNWLPGWAVYVNGRIATQAQYPNMLVSGNIVSFGTAVSGTITASYTFEHYTLTKTPLNTITIIAPVASNAISGAYTLILSRVVVLHTPADTNYQRTNLLNPNGTPNGLFYEITARLLEGSPIHFGRARWGIEANWLERSEDKPLTEHLPSVFDVITGY